MKWKFWLGIVISVACVYVVFRGIDWRKVLAAIQSANGLYLALAVILNLSTMWLRAERWKYLLEPIKRLRCSQLVPATMIGFMANNVLPARAGEFVRAYLIGRQERIKKTAAFTTIVLERVCDMTTILLVLVVVLFTVTFPPPPATGESGPLAALLTPAGLRASGAVSAVFVGGLIVCLIILKQFPQVAIAIIRAVFTPFSPRLCQTVLELEEAFREGLQVLKTGMHLVYIVGWSLMVWLAACTSGWLVMLAFNLGLSFLATAFIMVLSAFAVAAPSSPGYVGVFHWAVKTGVLLFLPELDEEVALGVAIIYHLVAILPVTAAGLWYLWKAQLSFADIQHIAEEQSDAAPEESTEPAAEAADA
jgi:glycosyltransferase 2 family protein